MISNLITGKAHTYICYIRLFPIINTPAKSHLTADCQVVYSKECASYTRVIIEVFYSIGDRNDAMQLRAIKENKCIVPQHIVNRILLLQLDTSGEHQQA